MFTNQVKKNMLKQHCNGTPPERRVTERTRPRCSGASANHLKAVNSPGKEGKMRESKSDFDDPAMIRSILPFAKAETCNAGEKLIESGEHADCFYYVEEGAFEVSYVTGQTSIVVAMIGKGAFIGEIGFFDGYARTRRIRAASDARTRVFDQSVLDRLLSEEPALYGRFMAFVLRTVCDRFRQILSDRGPLTAYAASLSTGKERFQGVQPLPTDLMGSTLWRETSRYLENFKADMFDIAHQLQKDSRRTVAPDLQVKGEQVLDQLKAEVRRIGPVIENSDAANLIWGYVFKEVFPYLMRSRFAERAYYKPKGYAGDFLMIESIYQNRPDGDGKLGRLIDAWVLNQVPARSVRSRRYLLKGLLGRFCAERLDRPDTIRIMNLACGPGRELFDLLKESGYGNRIEALCIDIDPEALEYSDLSVNTDDHGATITYMKENIIKWAIGRIKHDFEPQDIIYSSGLCDYLDRRLVAALIERCHQNLKPGGVLIIGNFSPANPDRYFMDQLLYWRLIHREAGELEALFVESPFGGKPEIVAEDEAVNLFAVARKKQ